MHVALHERLTIIETLRGGEEPPRRLLARHMHLRRFMALRNYTDP